MSTERKPDDWREKREHEDEMEFIADHDLEEHATNQPQARQASEYGSPSSSSEPSTKPSRKRKGGRKG